MPQNSLSVNVYDLTLHFWSKFVTERQLAFPFSTQIRTHGQLTTFCTVYIKSYSIQRLDRFGKNITFCFWKIKCDMQGKQKRTSCSITWNNSYSYYASCYVNLHQAAHSKKNCFENKIQKLTSKVSNASLYLASRLSFNCGQRLRAKYPLT